MHKKKSWAIFDMCTVNKKKLPVGELFIFLGDCFGMKTEQ